MVGTKEIDNRADVIDSRDVIERIEFLEVEMEDACTGQSSSNEYTRDWLKETADDDAHTMQNGAKELLALLALQEEAKDYSGDWPHGSTLIRDSYFTDSMRELCEDCGYIPKDFPSFIEIDWDATAKNLQADYTSVDFDGVTYWIR